ncbi:MAG: hypothetical protein R3344_03360, partial [Acidobacteriota bacterium]|nr:hypothetical protein [Acidobacteriota bacterium]
EAEGIDIRAIWEGLRGSPDGDFVTVRGAGENVRVAKSEGYLLVDVDEEDEKVRVRLPVEVVDALFTGTDDDDQLNLIGAIEALSRHAGEEIVTVESGSETVRIWIDNEPEGRQ